MIMGLFGTMYVLFIVVKGRALTVEEMKAYIPQCMHPAIDQTCQKASKLVGRGSPVQKTQAR